MGSILIAYFKIFANSPPEAEALGLREVVVLGCNLHRHYVIFEFDCHCLVETLRKQELEELLLI